MPVTDPIAYCLLPIAYCLLPIAYCRLPARGTGRAWLPRGAILSVERLARVLRSDLVTTDAATSIHDGRKTVRLILRAEGAVALALSLAAYHALGYTWWLFAATLLAPDLAMLGYLRDPATGAITYNLAHTYVAPFILALIGYFTGVLLLIALAAVWAAHIGLDRLLAYGLKYATAFQKTHLSPGA
jgi:Domain of unknown function (DUF4260)